MHRDALVALGESLQREFQDLLHKNEVTLTDLVEEAQRLLASFDNQMQALAAWLTSSSVVESLPSAVPREAVAVGTQPALPPTSWRALPVTAHRPTVESGAPLLQDAPRKAAARPDALPLDSQTSEVPDVMGTRLSSRPPSARLAAPAVFPPAADTVAPPYSDAVLADTPPFMVSAPGGAPQALLMTAFQVERAGKAEALLETAEYAAVPGEVVLPAVSVPSQTGLEPFTAAKNLHDLTRFLATGEPTAASPAVTAASENGTAAASAAAGSATPEAEHAVVWPDTRGLATLLLQEEESLRVAQEERLVPVPAIGPGNSLPPDLVRDHNTTGAMAMSLPQTGGPEMDMESLMEALARQVVEDYRRFYGSA